MLNHNRYSDNFMKKNKLVLIICLSAFCLNILQTNAQKKIYLWEVKINAGYNIGGTSPLPLPAEIRKIEKYSPPAFAPHIALEVTRWFNDKWGISAQFTMDYKGFTVRDSVLNLHTEIEMGDETYTGAFTGHNKTKISNSYITVPITATYKISDKWLVQAGLYAAYLYNPGFSGTASDGYIRKGGPTGEKTEVDEATFDFSDDLNKIDFGIQVAGEWRFSTEFALRGQLAWGLRPVFPSDFTGMSFDMYNIYGTIGVSYILKR